MWYSVIIACDIVIIALHNYCITFSNKIRNFVLILSFIYVFSDRIISSVNMCWFTQLLVFDVSEHRMVVAHVQTRAGTFGDVWTVVLCTWFVTAMHCLDFCLQGYLRCLWRSLEEMHATELFLYHLNYIFGSW